MFLLICKLYICIQNVFGHIFYSSRLHLYWQFWQFEVQKLAYMLILAAGGMIPYLSSVPPPPLKENHPAQKPLVEIGGTPSPPLTESPPSFFGKMFS